MLQTWTNGKRLLRGDHYFWILGGHVQKSIEGLLRAVLHALLSGLSQSGVSDNLETIKHACESRWLSTEKGRAWNCKELKEMLLRLALTSNVKVFLLIDALDECDPQDRLGDLADVILWLSLLPNVKLCVSCRPWAPFTRRFVKATVLHLDQLTYHDMEVYIGKRLLCAENEADLCTDFHDGTLPAKQLICDVASAADGVFLWVELVVNALCSEIRTGCSIEQLRLATSQFPTDLDKYFQNLIFGRIGTTRPNIPKTAAALKLAMVLESELSKSSDPDDIPMSQDYLNFWLLSAGQLHSGFSWKYQLDPRYLAFDTAKKLRQTKAFLEEACKDLLVIHKHGQSYNVEFIHRTAFDFLCDNPASLPIKKHAPRHFSDEGFAMDLLKLRCICRLREIGMDCLSSRDLLGKMSSFQARLQDETALEIQQQWPLACESTVLETFQTRCTCLGLKHLSHRIADICASSGLHRYLLETVQDMPYEAVFQRGSYGDEHDYLALALLELEKADNRKASTIRLLTQALKCGCDPNVSFLPDRPKYPCGQSKWEQWIHVQYLYSQQHIRASRGDKAHQSIGVTKDINCQRIRENASIIEFLLQHGADPSYAPCTTDHQFERHCSLTSLHDLLTCIVPADCLSRLQTLRVACSSKDRRYMLRCNQRRRAIRSYIISEQRFVSRVIDRCPQELQQNEREDWASSHWDKWGDHQRNFLQALISSSENKVKCRTSKEGRNTGLLTCCLDCGSRSYTCLDCFHPHSLTEDAPCTTLSDLRITQPQGHTTFTLPFKIYPSLSRWFLDHEDPAMLNTAYQSLGFGPGELDFTREAALSTLKEWYAKNPIEPDPLQGDDLQDIALPEDLDVVALSINGPNTDETSTSH
jgi:hypothetical protein